MFRVINDLPVQQVRLVEVVIGGVCFRETFNSLSVWVVFIELAGKKLGRQSDALVLACEDHIVHVEFRRQFCGCTG